MRVEVRSKVPGATAPVLPAVLVELATETTTLRDLIRRAVLEQVNATRANAASARAMLDRQYLTDAEIQTMAASGAVRAPVVPAPPDNYAEVARAIRAFDRGAFAVFCGGRQVEALDDPLTLRLGEPVVFLRVTPLVGG
jgi:hypothetical protein